MPELTTWVHIPRDLSIEPFEVEPEEVVGAYHLHRDRTFLVPVRVLEDYRASVQRAALVREEMVTHYPPPQLVAITDRSRIAARK